MQNITSPAAGDDQSIEREIIAKGKTAPRITPARIDEVIKGVHYFTAAQGAWGAAAAMAQVLSQSTFSWQSPPELALLTFCVLVLENGFTVTGESACASPENFDAEIGRKIAFENAKQKIWMLEGYVLKSKLSLA